MPGKGTLLRQAGKNGGRHWMSSPAVPCAPSQPSIVLSGLAGGAPAQLLEGLTAEAVQDFHVFGAEVWESLLLFPHGLISLRRAHDRPIRGCTVVRMRAGGGPRLPGAPVGKTLLGYASPFLTFTSSARMLMAMSTVLRLPRGIPIGACSRSSWASVNPASRRRSRRCWLARRLPRAPT